LTEKFGKLVCSMGLLHLLQIYSCS